MTLTYDQLFPGRFLKAGEFDGRDVTLTISAVRLESLPQADGSERARGVISFAETKKELVLNRTNGECLKALWGPIVDEWVGHRVTLYPERDEMGLSDSGVCIRVKGSPELSEPVKVTIKLPRRRPRERTLVPTKPAQRRVSGGGAS